MVGKHLANLKLPLGDALQRTKADLTLEGQCWTVQTGVTQVQIKAAHPEAALGAASVPTYTVKELTRKAVSSIASTTTRAPGPRPST